MSHDRDDVLLRTLRERAIVEVARAIPPGPVALLDFPTYENPGDSAIWLGALAGLSAAGLPRPAYTSDNRTFDERMLRRAMPTGTILLMGGGNLGDLWPGAQQLRERVLSAFPDRAVVQLPQTIHFTDRDALRRARDTFAAHPNFTVLVRDARSLEIATNDLGVRAALCPDLAFCLTPSDEAALRVEPADARNDTLYLLRTDREAAGHSRSTQYGQSVDWVKPPSRRNALNQLARRLTSVVTPTPGEPNVPTATRRAMRAALSACYSAMARERLSRGCRLIGSARVVVTDRLHGHVLALLMGIPHVVLGDRNGKLRGFFDAWTASAGSARWAETPEDVLGLTRELLARRQRSSVERSLRPSAR